MNNAIRDILISAIRPYLKELEIKATYKNKPVKIEDIQLIIFLKDDFKTFKLNELVENLKNGKIET